MSLLSKIAKGIGKVAKSPVAASLLSAFPPTAGIGAALGGIQSVRAGVKAAGVAQNVLPGLGGGPLSILPSIIGAGRGLAGAVGGVARSRVGKIGAGVATGAIGAGVAEQFFDGAPARRRRAKGISATELRGYRKVATLVRACGMQPRAPAKKRRKC
jgi:hypothetical protein